MPSFPLLTTNNLMTNLLTQVRFDRVQPIPETTITTEKLNQHLAKRLQKRASRVGYLWKRRIADRVKSEEA